MTCATDPIVSAGELEVIRLLADGRTVAAIARRLEVTRHAVSMRLRRAGDRLGTTGTVPTVLACERRGLLGGHTHRAETVRREIADRHTTTCALLAPRRCNCGTDVPPVVIPTERPIENGAA